MNSNTASRVTLACYILTFSVKPILHNSFTIEHFSSEYSLPVVLVIGQLQLILKVFLIQMRVKIFSDIKREALNRTL